MSLLLPLAASMAACATPRPVAPPADGRFAAALAAPQDDGWPQPRGMFALRLAAGESTAESKGSPEEFDTDAVMVGLGFEGGGRTFGGGVKMEFTGTDGDLLEESGNIDTDLTSFDLFPFFMIRPTAPRFRIPIRVGPYMQVHSVTGENGSLPNIQVPETGTADESLDFYSLGLQLEIEPEFDIMRSDNLALSAYGQVRAGAAVAGLSADVQDDDNDYDTRSSNFGFETGIRFQAAKFLIEGGYVLRRTTYDETDPEFNSGLGADVRYFEADFDFSGIFLALGVRW
jgi:hypothetical protein